MHTNIFHGKEYNDDLIILNHFKWSTCFISNVDIYSCIPLIYLAWVLAHTAYRMIINSDPELATPKHNQSSGLRLYWGWEVLDFAISGSDQFRTMDFFLDFGTKGNCRVASMTTWPDSPHTRPSGALNEYLKDYCLRFKKVLEQPGEEIVTPVRLFLV